MTVETKAAMERAMAEHFADEMNGTMLTAWWLVLAGNDFDRPGTTSYHYVVPDTQAFDRSLGLSAIGAKYLDAQYRGDL